jgi:thiosulfate dehydrogenase
MRFLKGAVVAAALLLAAGCGGGSSGRQPPAVQGTFDPSAVPKDQVGDLVRYGHELFVNTRMRLKPYVTANMDCAACHVDAGTKPRGGSLVGVAAQFPQWNTRAKRVIALQDRIAECFLYSMNGHPPAYQSREMEAMVAYITYLSRGTKIGSKPDPATRLAHFDPPKPADPKTGAQVYAQKCSSCHGASGAGSAAFPPLWGATSFNGGAGMHSLWTMAGFVRYNMPQNAPGTLSDQQAYDVSAFVLSHSRPKFDKTREVAFPPQNAGYF